MTPEQKNWIDKATYAQLLEKWRFEPTPSKWFEGDTGEYFSQVMFRKRDEDPDGAVLVSKMLGWER